MKHSKIYDLNKNFDPLDLVEDLIVNNNWHYERDQDDNIHVEVGGEWCDDQLSFGFNGKTVPSIQFKPETCFPSKPFVAMSCIPTQMPKNGTALC